VDFYAVKKGSTNEIFIGSSDNISENISINWSINPGSGEYQIFANMFDQKNRKYVSSKITVNLQ